MLIIHGENTVLSRNALQQQLDQARAQAQTITRLEARTVEPAQLEQVLGNQNLFGETNCIVIEELHSLPKSKRKDQLIEHVAAVTESGTHLILWEKKSLTATMLKKFKHAQVQEFKLTSSLFKWLDTLTGKPSASDLQRSLPLLHQALNSDGEVMCFTFLTRQVRLLIQAQEGQLDGVAPFIATKLRKQAQLFTLDQLLQLHHHLLELDTAHKTSSNSLSLGAELELLLMGM